MKKSKLFLFWISTIILLLSACSNNQAADTQQTESAEGHAEHTANEDIQEETPSIETLPTFLKEKPEDMKTIYSAAAKNKELLESMPCYCGCGDSAGHRNNYDCFIYNNKDDGAIVWDDHATRCKVCLDIAAESVVLYSKGKTPKEIRELIDERYHEGYAKPTPTPKPEV